MSHLDRPNRRFRPERSFVEGERAVCSTDTGIRHRRRASTEPVLLNQRSTREGITRGRYSCSACLTVRVVYSSDVHGQDYSTCRGSFSLTCPERIPNTEANADRPAATSRHCAVPCPRAAGVDFDAFDTAFDADPRSRRSSRPPNTTTRSPTRWIGGHQPTHRRRPDARGATLHADGQRRAATHRPLCHARPVRAVPRIPHEPRDSLRVRRADADQGLTAAQRDALVADYGGRVRIEDGARPEPSSTSYRRLRRRTRGDDGRPPSSRPGTASRADGTDHVISPDPRFTLTFPLRASQ